MGEVNSDLEPSELLKVYVAEMKEAKEAKEMKRVKVLRQRIWLLNDLLSGLSSDMSPEDQWEVIKFMPLSIDWKKKFLPRGFDLSQINIPRSNMSDKENDASIEQDESEITFYGGFDIRLEKNLQNDVTEPVEDVTETPKKDWFNAVNTELPFAQNVETVSTTGGTGDNPISTGTHDDSSGDQLTEGSSKPIRAPGRISKPDLNHSANIDIPVQSTPEEGLGDNVPLSPSKELVLRSPRDLAPQSPRALVVRPKLEVALRPEMSVLCSPPRTIMKKPLSNGDTQLPNPDASNDLPPSLTNYLQPDGNRGRVPEQQTEPITLQPGQKLTPSPTSTRVSYSEMAKRSLVTSKTNAPTAMVDKTVSPTRQLPDNFPPAHTKSAILDNESAPETQETSTDSVELERSAEVGDAHDTSFTENDFPSMPDRPCGSKTMEEVWSAVTTKSQQQLADDAYTDMEELQTPEGAECQTKHGNFQADDNTDTLNSSFDEKSSVSPSGDGPAPKDITADELTTNQIAADLQLTNQEPSDSQLTNEEPSASRSSNEKPDDSPPTNQEPGNSQPTNEGQAAGETKTPTTSSTTVNMTYFVNKQRKFKNRLRNIEKKLEKIKELKEKLAKGEELTEKNQLALIAKEAELEEEGLDIRAEVGGLF